MPRALYATGVVKVDDYGGIQTRFNRIARRQKETEAEHIHAELRRIPLNPQCAAFLLCGTEV